MLVVLFDVLQNSRLQFAHAAKGAAAETLLRQLAKPPLDEVEPRTAGRRKMHVKARMALQPALYLGMLVRGVIVSHEVQIEAGYVEASMSLGHLIHFWCRCRDMQASITSPSATSRAANSVVVP